MGLLGGDSKSTSVQQAANDSGRILYGKASRYVESGGVSIGDKATVKLGSDLSGAKVGGDVIIGDPNASATLATAFQGALSKVGEIAGTVTAASQSMVDKFVSQKTEQVAWYRSPLVWGGVLLLGALGAVGLLLKKAK